MVCLAALRTTTSFDYNLAGQRTAMSVKTEQSAVAQRVASAQYNKMGWMTGFRRVSILATPLTSFKALCGTGFSPAGSSALDVGW